MVKSSTILILILHIIKSALHVITFFFSDWLFSVDKWENSSLCWVKQFLFFNWSNINFIKMFSRKSGFQTILSFLKFNLEINLNKMIFTFNQNFSFIHYKFPSSSQEQEKCLIFFMYLSRKKDSSFSISFILHFEKTWKYVPMITLQ